MGAKKIKWVMVLLFSAMGILLWVAVLLAVMILCGIIWIFCQTMLWLMGLTNLATRRIKAATPKRTLPPARKPATREITPDIMPKWNAARRRYVDRDLADWQERFDALNSRRL